MSNNTLGQRVKAIRSELNLSQKELAEKIGTTIFVRRWDLGRWRIWCEFIRNINGEFGVYSLEKRHE